MALKRLGRSWPELVAAYCEDCLARGQSDRTVEGKRSALSAFAAWCGAEGLRRASQLTEEALEGYRRYLHAYRQPYTRQPLDIATQRNRLTAVKVFLRWLKRWKVIAADPGEGFELPRVPRRLPRCVLTVPEVEAMMAQTALYGLKGLRDRAVLETYYATGIRRMELARLDVEDVDLHQGIVIVNRGKGGKDRRVPIALRACDWIRRYLKDARPVLAKVGSGRALFLANDGERFGEQRLTRIASHYVKRAGIKKRGACNLFRHTTATLMHENGADILHVKEMLGHADVSTTQVYIRVAIGKLREVYAQTHPAAFRHQRPQENRRWPP